MCSIHHTCCVNDKKCICKLAVVEFYEAATVLCVLRFDGVLTASARQVSAFQQAPLGTSMQLIVVCVCVCVPSSNNYLSLFFMNREMIENGINTEKSVLSIPV